MSILSALMSGGRVNSIQQALGAKDITSTDMKAALLQWFALYFDGVVDKDKEDGCQRLPVVIVGKLVKTTFAEYEAKSTTQGRKADFVQGVLDAVDKVRAEAMQDYLIGGECFLRPVPVAGGFELRAVRRDCYLPLGRGANGAITDVGMAELSTEANRQYLVLERRTLLDSGDLLIKSRLFLSDSTGAIGRPVPLDTLPRYAALQPELTLPGLNSLGMVPLRTPIFNCVDGSPDGVAVYAPAVGLIRNANRNEKLLDAEFEHGRSRIIASDDMITRDENGKGKLDDDLFVAIEDSAENVGVTIFSPTLREQSYLARKNEYLRNIESMIGLKRGILSEVEATERTATEVTSNAGDYNLTILDFQQVWEMALLELVGVCDKLGQLYHLCDGSKLDPKADIVVDWGNGVLYDEDKEWERRMAMVAAGMLKPELALAWKFNLPCGTTEELADIRAAYMPELETMMGGA